MKLLISEILGKLKDFTGDGSVAKKAEWLRKNDSPTLRMILQHSFDPTVVYNLPEGEPPFKKNESPIGTTESTLYAETRKLSYLWAVPSTAALQNLTKTQTEQLAEIQKIQQERGVVLQEATATFKASEQEIHDAREAIEAAKLRYTKALATQATTAQALNEAKKLVNNVDIHIQKIQEEMYRANAQLDSRLTPPPTNMPRYRLEMLFIQILESIHFTEAEVLLAAKNKTLTKKFPITKDIVKKAFPDLLK